VLERVRTDDTASCTGFALQESLRHRQALLAEPLPAEVVERYEKMAVDSVAAQRAAEDADQLPFEAFRRQYLSQPLVEDIRVTTRRAG
jgi:glutamate--cysteine ligase